MRTLTSLVRFFYFVHVKCGTFGLVLPLSGLRKGPGTVPNADKWKEPCPNLPGILARDPPWHALLGTLNGCYNLNRLEWPMRRLAGERLLR